MQISKKSNFFTVVLTVLFLTSCTSQNKIKVTDAYYSPYQYGDEKGYNVHFIIKNKGVIPSYIILNKIQQKIYPPEQKTSIYTLKVVAESRKINDFKPVISNKENGIGFVLDSEEVFVPVKFQIRK